MADQLLPPPRVPPERAVAVWIEVMDAGVELLRAGFAARFGPDQVEEKYREWCQQQIVENDRRLVHLLTELTRREAGHGQ